MRALRFRNGLLLSGAHAQRGQTGISRVITEEAALTPSPGEELRLDLIVAENEDVAQGQPVARLRGVSTIALVAPMAGRIAAVQFRPGHRLKQIVLFSEPGLGRHRFSTEGAEADPAKLRHLMQAAGLWRQLRSRPFGKMPGESERVAALFVMAADSRAGAPDPRLALDGRGEDFERGLAALATLTDGPVFLCALPGALPGDDTARLTRIDCGALHPMGLAGIHVHRHFPAAPQARVWDIHAEDVADLGALLATGYLPETRLVSLTGPALRAPQLLRCQHGADLRGLSQPLVKPGPHDILSGSALDGHPAHWLQPRDRLVSVLPHDARSRRPHWFQSALQSAARPVPIIPTAALTQALGGAMPAAALARALGAGDSETAVKLGALSLLEEDLALADYVTAADPPLSKQLRVLLDRVQSEEAEP